MKTGRGSSVGESATGSSQRFALSLYQSPRQAEMTIAVEHKEELKKQIELQKADYF
jgi:hypothetical protein